MSSFGERLKHLSDTFYSTILHESEDKKIRIKNVKELEELKMKTLHLINVQRVKEKSNADFSFTFNSIVETNREKIK